MGSLSTGVTHIRHAGGGGGQHGGHVDHFSFIFQRRLGLLLALPSGPGSVERVGVLGKMLNNMRGRLTDKAEEDRGAEGPGGGLFWRN